MKADENVNLEEDWKLVTLFIGGNDLCASCRNLFHYSAEQYVEHIKKGIDYLYYEVRQVIGRYQSNRNFGPITDLTTANPS